MVPRRESNTRNSRIEFGDNAPFNSSNLTFSPDSRLLGACVGQSIQLWTVNPPAPRQLIPLSQNSECDFGFTVGGRGIAYVDGEEIVTWDIAEERVTARNRPPLSPNPYPGSSDRILRSFAVAPNGRTAIFQDLDGKLLWWDLDRQDSLPGIEIPSLGIPVSISFTPDSRLAAVDMSSAVLLIDVMQRTPTAIYSVSGYRSGGLNPDGSLIAASAGRGVIALTEVGEHKMVPVNQVRYFAVHPNGRHLTTISYAGEVAIHSFEDPERMNVIPPANNELIYEAIEDLSPNDLQHAVTVGDSEHHIRLREVSSLLAPEVLLKGHGSEVLRLSFDPSSEFLASADKSEVIVWSVRDQAELSRISLPKDYDMESLAVGPEGRYVATAASDGKAFLWDTASNNPVPTPLPLDGSTSLIFSPDGRWLSIGNQSEIKLWRLNMGEIDPQRIPISGAQEIKFSPDGTLLATSYSSDFSSGVTVWSIRDARIAGTVAGNRFSSLDSFAFMPDSARLAVAGDGISLVPFDTQWALRHVCRITGRNLTQEEWNQHAQGFNYIATCP